MVDQEYIKLSSQSKEMKKQGIDIILEVNIDKVSQKNDKYSVKLDNNDKIECDLVFSAIGRVPNTDALNLYKAGINAKDNGQVVVDDDYQTSNAHIYAVGDVTDRVNLTPIALAERT